MILSIEGQLVNAYIEPQFLNVAGVSIVTVEFYAWESMPKLRTQIQGDLRAKRFALYWCFTGYLHLEELCSLVENPGLSRHDLLIAENTSPAPVAYEWVGMEADIEICEDEYESGETHYGHSLPDEIDSYRWDGPSRYEYFFAYPLFSMPQELLEITARI